jgi:dihydrofolate reductase
MNKLIEILNCDEKWGIGKRNGLLFVLPKDMAFFRKTTLNHVVAMGENTLLSFPNAKPLKNRTHIVLSSDPSHNYEGVINVHSFEAFLNSIKEKLLDEDVYIIGGASIYRQMLPYCDEVLLTKVLEDGEAEVFFENLDSKKEWSLASSSPLEDDNGHKIKFCVYLNKKKTPL